MRTCRGFLSVVAIGMFAFSVLARQGHAQPQPQIIEDMEIGGTITPGGKAVRSPTSAPVYRNSGFNGRCYYIDYGGATVFMAEDMFYGGYAFDATGAMIVAGCPMGGAGGFGYCDFVLSLYDDDPCLSGVQIAGTALSFTGVPADGYVYRLDGLGAYSPPVPVTPAAVDGRLWLHLECTGGDCDGAMWCCADSTEPVGVSWYSLWVDYAGYGCVEAEDWESYYYRRFLLATVEGESMASMSIVPVAVSGAGSIVGDTATLDCHDLPQWVKFDVLGDDWDPLGAGNQLAGYETRVDCALYLTGDAGTLDMSPYTCLPGPCPGFDMGIDKTRSDYAFFGLEDFAGC